MAFHRIRGTNEGNFTIFGEKMKGKPESAGVYFMNGSNKCKFGDLRVVNLRNLNFFSFKDHGSKYEVEKNGELRITQQLSRDLTAENFQDWKTNLQHWKNHLLLNLKNTDDKKDKKNEFYFTKGYRESLSETTIAATTSRTTSVAETGKR